MSDDSKGAILVVATLAIAFGFGAAFAAFSVSVYPTKVERIHSPSGLIVVTPEGKKVFVPDSAITPETPGK